MSDTLPECSQRKQIWHLEFSLHMITRIFLQSHEVHYQERFQNRSLKIKRFILVKHAHVHLMTYVYGSE